MEDLTYRQELISKKVWEMYSMLDEESLLKQVRKKWINWVNQVPVFGFNSRKYDLNLVKEYFIKTLYSYMFLTTPMFKFLDVKNYLAPGLSYVGWCKANGCMMEKLVFPYEWLDYYNKLSHVGPVEYENFYSKLRGGFTITPDEYTEFVREFHSRGCMTMMDWL